MRSLSSSVPADFVFQNISGVDVQPLWLDFKGNEIPYGSIKPGQTKTWVMGGRGQFEDHARTAMTP
jgi:hypothetical protein